MMALFSLNFNGFFGSIWVVSAEFVDVDFGVGFFVG